MSRAKILVVDDDADIRSLLVQLLGRAGHEVTEAADGKAALRALYATPADLVVLDVTMPKLDGWKTLERIRDLSDLPVLMLTARSGELEKVRGLKAGADDYLTKPFGRQELVARVEALLRRVHERPTRAETYADDFVQIDFGRREVTTPAGAVTLTPREFHLLSAFVHNPNQVLSHGQLLEQAWGDEDGSRERVKLYVSYLRHKLGADAPIETVRGFGYRYRAGRG